MDSFSELFSVATTNATCTTTTMATTALSSSSSNVSLAQQNTGHVSSPDNSEPLGLLATPSHALLMQFRFPPPYILPYNPNMIRLPYMHTSGHPMCPYPMGQSNVWFNMQNSQLQGWSQLREEDRKVKEAWSKIARDKRKQARQRSKSSASAGAPLISKGTIVRGQGVTYGGSNVKVAVTPNRNPYVFHAPDGKRLEEILTKKLKNSDVGSLGRIVLPKREAEEKLPALCDKEGIDIVLKDVYSDLRWSLKYKYWTNNKSRMYVLENTGEFVNHYELRIGDSMTLYKDELKNLYVSKKKVQNAEVTDHSLEKERPQTQDNYSCMQTLNTIVEAKDDEEEAYLAVLIKELNHKREEAAANSLLTLCNGGCSSTEAKYHQMGQHTLPDCIDTIDGASSQVSEQAIVETATSSSKDQTAVMIVQRNNFHDVYGGIDNNFEAGCNYLVFDHLTE